MKVNNHFTHAWQLLTSSAHTPVVVSGLIHAICKSQDFSEQAIGAHSLSGKVAQLLEFSE